MSQGPEADLDLDLLTEMREAMRPGAFDAVLTVFVTDTRERLASARAAFDRGDRQTLAALCHSLKSTLGSFGAVGAAALADRLEDMDVGDTEARPLLETLERAAGAAVDELLRRFSTTPGSRAG